VAEVPEGFGSADDFLHILTTPPSWADGMPIAAKVREGPRFCKTAVGGSSSSSSPVAAAPEAPAEVTTMTYDTEQYPSGEREWGSDVAEYIYRDKDGEPYLCVKRTSEKQFPQYHRENGRWKKGAPKGAKLPYRLPQLLAAAPEVPVLICEGEKDADNVAALGF